MFYYFMDCPQMYVLVICVNESIVVLRSPSMSPHGREGAQIRETTIRYNKIKNTRQQQHICQAAGCTQFEYITIIGDFMYYVYAYIYIYI